MATEASQPLKISLPVSAALAQALYNEFTAATINNGYAGTPAQYTFVKVNALGQADLIAAAKDIAIGVIQNAPFVYSQGASQAGGAAGEIVVLGMTKVRAGGTVTLNASTPRQRPLHLGGQFPCRHCRAAHGVRVHGRWIQRVVGRRTGSHRCGIWRPVQGSRQLHPAPAHRLVALLVLTTRSN